MFFAAGWWRGEPLGNLLLVSISLAVAAIPEALPAVGRAAGYPAAQYFHNGLAGAGAGQLAVEQHSGRGGNVGDGVRGEADARRDAGPEPEQRHVAVVGVAGAVPGAGAGCACSRPATNEASEKAKLELRTACG